MGNGKTSSPLLKGAALLGGAALVSKLIGTLQKIPLQNVAGDEVFGLYSAVYAFAIMWITLAAAGVPTAVSMLVAERYGADEAEESQRILRWSIAILGATGILGFAVMVLFADTFAEWMGAPGAAGAIRMSSVALLFGPATAAMRGYRQGQMRMLRPAVSQLAEQSARVAFMLIMLFWAVGAGWSTSAVAASLHGGLAAGASAGLIVMLLPARHRRATFEMNVAGKGIRKAVGGGDTVVMVGADGTGPASGERPKVRFPESRLALVKRIVSVAIPIAIASVSAPLLGLIDAFSIPRLLQRDPQQTAAEAMAAFGVYNRGVALLQLILMAAGGAAAALVPSLTAARARGGQGEDTSTQAAFSLRLAWWLGGSSAVGLALLAAPIDTALFADAAGSSAIAIIAAAALFGTHQAVSAGLLQGLGQLRAPAVNLAAAAIFKLALNALLVPRYGIAGAAAAMALAFAAAAALNALSLRQRIALPPASAASAWRPAAALAAMAAAVAALAALLAAALAALPERSSALLVALPCVALGAAVFAAGLVAFGALEPSQWRTLPLIRARSRLDRILSRIYQSSARLHRKTEHM